MEVWMYLIIPIAIILNYGVIYSFIKSTDGLTKKELVTVLIPGFGLLLFALLVLMIPIALVGIPIYAFWCLWWERFQE